MKVTVVAGAFHRANQGVYGSESQASVLARGFLKAGHDVTFIAAAGSDPVGKFRTVPCMYAQLYPNEEKFAYEWYKDELVEQDLIIDWSGTHRVTENMYFWERSRFKGVLIWSHQGNVFSSPRGPPLYTYHGTVVSQAQKDHALANPFFSNQKTAGDRVHVLPYGMDTESYQLPEGGSRREYFLYLSRPHPHKGIFEFLQLARDFPEEKFVMAFDMAAPDHVLYGNEAIRQAKADHPNVTYVPLKGSLAKKVELYQHAKALVTPLAPDYVEGFGLVFAEAMLCGTPCITATHGGQVDVVGNLGFLCSVHVEYVKAIREVAQMNSTLLNNLGVLGRNRIVRKFGVDRWVAAYLKLYTKIRRELDATGPGENVGWLYKEETFTLNPFSLGDVGEARS